MELWASGKSALIVTAALPPQGLHQQPSTVETLRHGAGPPSSEGGWEPQRTAQALCLASPPPTPGAGTSPGHEGTQGTLSGAPSPSPVCTSPPR